MSLSADIVVDRRRLKRRLVVWQIVAVLSLIAGAIVVFAQSNGPGQVLRIGPYVAVVSVEGVIIDDRDRALLFRRLAEDDDVRAVLVRIDSPGGTAVGGEALFRQIRSVAEVKPVVAVMRSLATSAAYMAAIASDHIIARSSTITGSIGVLLQTTDVTTLLDSIGVKPEAIKSTPLKAQPNPLEPFSEEARRATQAVVDDIYAMFVEMVVDRRSAALSGNTTFADGRVFTGRQAKELGLIDAIGGETEARSWLAEQRDIDPRLPLRERALDRDHRSVAEFVLQLLGNAFFSGAHQLDGVVSVWHPSN